LLLDHAAVIRSRRLPDERHADQRHATGQGQHREKLQAHVYASGSVSLGTRRRFNCCRNVSAIHASPSADAMSMHAEINKHKPIFRSGESESAISSESPAPTAPAKHMPEKACEALCSRERL
jgi:hypothetical protein